MQKNMCLKDTKDVEVKSGSVNLNQSCPSSHPTRVKTNSDRCRKSAGDGYSCSNSISNNKVLCWKGSVSPIMKDPIPVCDINYMLENGSCYEKPLLGYSCDGTICKATAMSNETDAVAHVMTRGPIDISVNNPFQPIITLPTISSTSGTFSLNQTFTSPCVTSFIFGKNSSGSYGILNYVLGISSDETLILLDINSPTFKEQNPDTILQISMCKTTQMTGTTDEIYWMMINNKAIVYDYKTRKITPLDNMSTSSNSFMNSSVPNDYYGKILMYNKTKKLITYGYPRTLYLQIEGSDIIVVSNIFEALSKFDFAPVDNYKTNSLVDINKITPLVTII